MSFVLVLSQQLTFSSSIAFLLLLFYSESANTQHTGKLSAILARGLTTFQVL